MRGLRAFVLAGIAVAVLAALVLSPWASSEPDGLTKVAQDHGFDSTERRHALSDGPMADYSVRGLEDERWSTRVAGIAGIALTFVVAAGLIALVRRRSRPRPGAPR